MKVSFAENFLMQHYNMSFCYANCFLPAVTRESVVHCTQKAAVEVQPFLLSSADVSATSRPKFRF